MSNILNIKKRLSVDLAKALETPLQQYYGLFKIIEDEEKYILHIVDRDKDSDIYFGIIKETYDTSGHYVHYSCKPYNNTKKESLSTSTKIANIPNILKHWLENLKYYEEDSVLNDPLIRGYRNEFFADFKITDDNADFEGFSYSQQRQLSAFFEKISEEIEILKDEKNKVLVETLKNDITELQNSVTSETKNGLMKKFSLVLAKARKGSVKVCDFILKEFVKEFIKDGAKFAFGYVKDNVHKLPEYIQQLSDIVKQLQ